MKRILIGCILLFNCLFLTCCFAAPQGIEEITVSEGGRDHKGDGHYSTIIFHRDGPAEKDWKKFVHDVTVIEHSHSRGQISKEQFEKLEKALIQNNFFSSEDRGASRDYAQTIKVVYSKGTKTLEARPDDPQMSAIVAAVEEISQTINWEKTEEIDQPQ